VIAATSAHKRGKKIKMRFYLCHSYPLTKTGNKNIWVGVVIKDLKPSAQILIYGDSSGINFTRDQFHALLQHRDVIFQFMSQETPTLSFEIPSNDKIISVNGRHGKTPMLVVTEFDHSSRNSTVICLGKVTIERLFELQYLISHYFDIIHSNLNELENIIVRFKHTRKTADFDSFGLKHANGIDFHLFLHELFCFSAEFE